MKLPVKNDLVLPKLKIDSSVLFDPGAATLLLQVAQEELDKVVQFVRAFSPSKLSIEGHTDSNGDNNAICPEKQGLRPMPPVALVHNLLTTRGSWTACSTTCPLRWPS